MENPSSDAGSSQLAFGASRKIGDFSKEKKINKVDNEHKFTIAARANMDLR